MAEHKEQIHEAVDAVGGAADCKTGGKHAAKIAKMGQKAGEAIDKFGAEDERGRAAGSRGQEA